MRGERRGVRRERSREEGEGEREGDGEEQEDEKGRKRGEEGGVMFPNILGETWFPSFLFPLSFCLEHVGETIANY